MVTTAGAILLIIALAAPGDAKPASAITVSVLAVQASNEQRETQPSVAEQPAPKAKRNDNSLRTGFAPGLNAKGKPRKNGANGNRHFDPGLESIRDSVASLPYNTYHEIKSDKKPAATNQAAEFAINDKYTVSVTPLDTDPEGRLRLKVVIDEQSTVDGATKTRKALDTTSAIAPGKHLLLRGLPLPDGELIVFVSAQR